MISDASFFKCVDDSVKLFSKYGKQATYYYNYAHRSQFSLVSTLGVPEDLDLGKYRPRDEDELYRFTFDSTAYFPI